VLPLEDVQLVVDPLEFTLIVPVLVLRVRDGIEGGDGTT
jgi:hypothetical protein